MKRIMRMTWISSLIVLASSSLLVLGCKTSPQGPTPLPDPRTSRGASAGPLGPPPVQASGITADNARETVRQLREELRQETQRFASSREVRESREQD